MDYVDYGLFKGWLNDYCYIHTKLQIIGLLLEHNLLLDLFQVIRTLIEIRRSCWIEWSSTPYRTIYGASSEEKIVWWWPNGVLRSWSTYTRENKNGISIGWGMDGSKLTETVYVDGERTTDKTWNGDGHMLYDWTYKNKVRNGAFRQWWIGGLPQFSHNYVDGKKHGLQRNWDCYGLIENEEIYYYGLKIKTLRCLKDIHQTNVQSVA